MHSRAPRPLIQLNSVTASQVNDADNANARAISKITKTKIAIAKANEDIPPPYKVDDIVLLHNPVVNPGPGGRRLALPYSKQCRIVAINLPSNISIVPHPHGGAVEKVNMSRVKLAHPSLQLKHNPAIPKTNIALPAATAATKSNYQAKTPMISTNLTPQAPVSVYSTPIGKEPPTAPAKDRNSEIHNEPPAKRPLKTNLKSPRATESPNPMKETPSPPVARKPIATTKAGRVVFGNTRYSK